MFIEVNTMRAHQVRPPLSQMGGSAVGKDWVTSQDGSVQPRYAATWRAVMQVGLIKV